jgi:sulfate permease, SulP family
VTVAALALPSAMAYGELAGLSPLAGLYTLLLPTVAYVLLGSSKRLIIGPEGSISALVAAAVLPLAATGSADAAEVAGFLALLVAACFLLGWILRLHWISDYLSRPVLIGYIHGVAVVLVISQIDAILGLDVDSLGAPRQLVEMGREFGDGSGATLAVGAAALAVLLPLRFVWPRVPTALFVVVASIAFSWAWDLESVGVAVVGDIASGLPSLGIPWPGWSDAFQLAPAAVGIFLVAFADEILTARSFAGKHGEHVRGRQELLAMGVAHGAAGVSGGFPLGASGSRTAVNDSMGARTQVAGLVAAGTVVLILLFLTDPIAYLPKAVLGAVIISAGIGLVDPDAWRALWTTDRVEVAIAAVTAGGVILVGVLEALVFAVGLSIVDVVRRSARPHDAVLGWVPRLGRYGDVSLHPSAELTPGVVVYRLDDRLFFANARYVKGRTREAVRGAPQPVQALVFDAEAVIHVDSTGADALAEIARDLERDGIALELARVKRFVKQVLDSGGVTEEIGEAHFHPTVRAAVAAGVASGRRD